MYLLVLFTQSQMTIHSFIPFLLHVRIKIRRLQSTMKMYGFLRCSPFHFLKYIQQKQLTWTINSLSFRDKSKWFTFMRTFFPKKRFFLRWFELIENKMYLLRIRWETSFLLDLFQNNILFLQNGYVLHQTERRMLLLFSSPSISSQ